MFGMPRTQTTMKRGAPSAYPEYLNAVDKKKMEEVSRSKIYVLDMKQDNDFCASTEQFCNSMNFAPLYDWKSVLVRKGHTIAKTAIT